MRLDFMKHIKRATGYDSYGYISSAINSRDYQYLDVLLNSPPPTGYKGTKDLQEAAKKTDKSLLDLAFEAEDKKIIKKILRSECANLHSVSKETTHNALANILLQDEPSDREELFQIIQASLTQEDYCNLLLADEVTDLLPRLFDLNGGVDQETVQGMFEEAIRDGYQRAAFVLFNHFTNIDLSFKADLESNLNPLEDLIYKFQYYSELPYGSNDDRAAIKDLLILLLERGDLHLLESHLVSYLFAGIDTSSDVQLIESLLRNKTYSLEQSDIKVALENIAGSDVIPVTSKILISHVLKNWNQDNIDSLKSISGLLVNILCKMEEGDKIRDVLSLILQKDLVTPFMSINDYNRLCTRFMEAHEKYGSQSHLEYAKIIMAHCFWRSELFYEKHHEEAIDGEQVKLLWKKLRGTKDKEILKLALKSEMIDVSEIALNEKHILNLYGVMNLFKSSLNKDIALFRAFVGFGDPAMIKSLINNKGFDIHDTNQFADELLGASDEIFQVSILELHKNGLLSEHLISELVQKLSEQCPSYKKQEILFTVSPEVTRKVFQRENKSLNLLELYKDGCSIDYMKKLLDIKGLDTQRVDIDGNTLLHAAVASGIEEDVKEVLKFIGSGINTNNKDGFTPLMLVCASDAGSKVEIADIIINHESFVWSKELRKTQSNHLLLSYLADKDGFGVSSIAEYLLGIPEIATEENIRDLLLVALADGKMNVIFPDNASIDTKLREVRNSKSFLQDAIVSNTQDIPRQSIVHRLIDETTISQEELPSVMFDVYKRGISTNSSNNLDLASYKISSLIQIAEKLGTDVNVQRVERIAMPRKGQEGLYVSTSILGLVCAHGAADVAVALMKLKDIDLNCGTKASGEIPEISPILMAYNALRNNQEEAKNATDVTKDARDLNKPYIEIIKALLEKEGLDLTKELSAGSGNISIAALLYSDPILSRHESTSTIRKNIIENICKSKGPSRIKDHLLMLASAAGDIAAVQTLLDNAASPLAKNEYGCHSLAIAAMNFGDNPEEYIKVIELLTSKVSIEEYKINEKDKTGTSTAHYIAAHCDAQTVKKILGGIDINNFKGDSKLLIGAYFGGDANVIEYISGLTEISDEVLKAIKDDHGNTVLHHLAISDQPGTVSLLNSLIKKGLDVNASNKHGVTPLISAVVSCSLDTIDALLLSKDLDINACDIDGRTALMKACEDGKKHEIIRRILNDPRVNISQTDNAGMSALMIISYKKYAQVVNNVEVQNEKEKLVWECDKQIVADFIRRGADPLFGKNSETFTAKMLLIMIKASLLTVANHFLLMFNPVLQRIGSVGIALHTAAEVGNAVGDMVANIVVEYGADNKIDLKGFPIIGSYHIDRFGRVISGDALKNAIDKAPQYQNAQESIAIAENLKDAARDLNNAARLEIHNDLIYKYQRIQNVLQSSNLLPWTRRGLEKVASEIVKADRGLRLAIDQDSSSIQVQDFKNNFKYIHSCIKKQNRQATIDLMLKDGAIDLGENTEKTKECFKDLLQKIVDGEIIADAKIVHNAKAFLDEYKKERDYRQDVSLFAGFKLKIKDLLKKIIPGMKPSKELLKAALASIANDPDKKVNKLAADHKKAIEIAGKEEPNIGISQETDKEERIFSKLVGYGNNLSNKILGSNVSKAQTVEQLAHSLGMVANIGARVVTFTGMENNLTINVVSQLLYYGATSTALSVASIGGGIAAAAYGLYKGAKWLAESSALETKADINIADECSIKANKVFSNSQNIMQYTGRQSKVHKLRNAFDDEGASESDSSYLDILSGNTAEQETNMAFKDRILAEQERLTQQYI